jgi:CheY-like chemotaxis protein
MGQLLGASISKKADVRYELVSDLPAVLADVTQMRQVIMNLITNASESLEGRVGTIHVRTGSELVGDSVEDLYGPVPLAPGSYAFLEVADEGCGMNDDARARLFEPFFTTKFSGRGLGLSAVQGIVRGHRGGIVLRTAVGCGTTIKVLLPCTDRPSRPISRPPLADGAEWTGTGLVLLVDDDARVRSVTEVLLRNLGFEVVSAASGREAIGELERRPDVRLVVLDVTMPDLGGEQVLKELRRLRPGVRVLLCSGYSEEDVLARFDRTDGTSFLQKPYRFEELRARLRGLSENSPASSAE